MPEIRLNSPLMRGGEEHPAGAELELEQAIIDALPDGVVAAPREMGLAQVLGCIREMDAERREAEWTRAGGPRLSALSKRLGQEISGELRDAAHAAWLGEPGKAGG